MDTRQAQACIPAGNEPSGAFIFVLQNRGVLELGHTPVPSKQMVMTADEQPECPTLDAHTFNTELGHIL